MPQRRWMPSSADEGKQQGMLERRQCRRYPIRLDVRISRATFRGQKWVRHESSKESRGKTIDMSSRGCFIKCDPALITGTFIEATIAWPVLLDGATPLQLIFIGRVMRRNEHGIGIARVDSFAPQFRTARLGS